MAKKKADQPHGGFGFAEMLDTPEGNAAALLADPATPAAVKDHVLRDVDRSISALGNVARRNTQAERWEGDKQHSVRDQVMAQYDPDQRGEAQRLATIAAKLTGNRDFPERTVRGWIEDSRKPAKAPPPDIARTWAAKIEGDLARKQRSEAAKRPRKRSPK